MHPAAVPGRGELVLVTDDDPDMLDIVSTLLDASGFEVMTAANGREALDRVGTRMPSVILLDMRMPVMDGWQFAAEFRARFPDGAKLVVMTAAEHASQRAAEIRADGWLAKPFALSKLVESVRAQLESSPNSGT